MSIPFIPFANCAEVVVQGVLASQQVFLTNGVQKASAFGGTDLQDIADIFASWVVSELLPILCDDLVINTIKASDLTTQFSPVAVSITGLPASGSVSGSPLTNQVAAVVSYKTAARGRSFRGRNYVPGAPVNSLQTATELTVTFVGNLVAAYQSLGIALGSANFNHVVLSRQENGVRRTNGVATIITDYIGRTALGTQRRRVIGHGI